MPERSTYGVSADRGSLRSLLLAAPPWRTCHGTRCTCSIAPPWPRYDAHSPMPLASAPSGPPTGRLRADAAREAQARPRPGDHMERWQRGIAALATGLLHLSLLLLAWWMPPLVPDRKGGSAA